MAANRDSYKVTLFSPAGAALDTFGVQASSDDEAKRLTKRWLEEHGYVVRSINFSTQPRTLIAYAAKK